MLHEREHLLGRETREIPGFPAWEFGCREKHQWVDHAGLPVDAHENQGKSAPVIVDRCA
jgi:hypothetical protein